MKPRQAHLQHDQATHGRGRGKKIPAGARSTKQTDNHFTWAEKEFGKVGALMEVERGGKPNIRVRATKGNTKDVNELGKKMFGRTADKTFGNDMLKWENVIGSQGRIIKSKTKPTPAEMRKLNPKRDYSRTAVRHWAERVLRRLRFHAKHDQRTHGRPNKQGGKRIGMGGRGASRKAVKDSLAKAGAHQVRFNGYSVLVTTKETKKGKVTETGKILFGRPPDKAFSAGVGQKELIWENSMFQGHALKRPRAPGTEAFRKFRRKKRLTAYQKKVAAMEFMEPRQFTIKQVGAKWCLFTKDGKKKLGCHDSKEGAMRQERVIQAHKHANEHDDSSPSRVFLNALRNELKSHVPDNVLIQAIRRARGRAGGIIRGRRRKVAASESDIYKMCASDQEHKREFALFMPLEFGDVGPSTWIPCLPKPGEYTHTRYGKITITKDRNQRFIDNFQNKVYQDQIPIDAEHESKLSGAFGYYKDFRTKGDGSVEALVEWTDRGREAVNKNRFKYFSPEWWDQWQDPMTQKVHKDVLIGGGLTTRPFFKEKAGMRTLVASEDSLEMESPEVGEEPVTFTTEQGGEKDMSKDQDEKGLMGKLVDLLRSYSEEDEIDDLELNLSSEDDAAGDDTDADDADDTKDDDTTVQATEEMKQMTERLQAAEAETKKATEEAKKARDEVTALRVDARTKRFSDKVTSEKWVGKHEDIVTLMGTMADKLGEDSKEFKAFVEMQSAHAKQIHSSKIFTELGDGGDTPEEGTPQGAANELEKKAKELLEADKDSSRFGGDYNRAFVEATRRNPELKSIYNQRFRN